jgi:hypothetical protein
VSTYLGGHLSQPLHTHRNGPHQALTNKNDLVQELDADSLAISKIPADPLLLPDPLNSIFEPINRVFDQAQRVETLIMNHKGLLNPCSMKDFPACLEGMMLAQRFEPLITIQHLTSHTGIVQFEKLVRIRESRF